MVETLAPHGYAGRLRTTLVACATFAAGALAGGVATFGGLALLGQALGAGGAAAIAVAAAVALAAAAGEARGARIVPQVRRQVPESWRRVLPLPLAAGLYGVLLGLGFTTFILSFAVWALAGVSVALGDPALGLLVGLGFGVGRTLPVVDPRPARGHRARRRRARRDGRAPGDPARAARRRRRRAGRLRRRAVGRARAGRDRVRRPGHRPERRRRARRLPGARRGRRDRPAGSARSAAPGPHPAVGGGRLAWIGDGTVEVRSQADPAVRLHAARRRPTPSPSRPAGSPGARSERRPRRAVRLAAAARRRPARGRRARRRARRSAARRSPATGCCSTSRARRAAGSTRSGWRSGAPQHAALGAARAAAQPVQRRPAAALRALDLPAPAAADRAR